MSKESNVLLNFKYHKNNKMLRPDVTDTSALSASLRIRKKKEQNKRGWGVWGNVYLNF